MPRSVDLQPRRRMGGPGGGRWIDWLGHGVGGKPIALRHRSGPVHAALVKEVRQRNPAWDETKASRVAALHLAGPQGAGTRKRLERGPVAPAPGESGVPTNLTGLQRQMGLRSPAAGKASPAGGHTDFPSRGTSAQQRARQVSKGGPRPSSGAREWWVDAHREPGKFSLIAPSGANMGSFDTEAEANSAARTENRGKASPAAGGGPTAAQIARYAAMRKSYKSPEVTLQGNEFRVREQVYSYRGTPEQKAKMVADSTLFQGSPAQVRKLLLAHGGGALEIQVSKPMNSMDVHHTVVQRLPNGGERSIVSFTPKTGGMRTAQLLAGKGAKVVDKRGKWSPGAGKPSERDRHIAERDRLKARVGEVSGMAAEREGLYDQIDYHDRQARGLGNAAGSGKESSVYALRKTRQQLGERMYATGGKGSEADALRSKLRDIDKRIAAKRSPEGKQSPAGPLNVGTVVTRGGEYGTVMGYVGQANYSVKFGDKPAETVDISALRVPGGRKGALGGKKSLPAGQEAYEQLKATASALGLPWDDDMMKKAMGVGDPDVKPVPLPTEVAKAAPKPTSFGSGLQSGRGPGGKLRNFTSMGDAKFKETYFAVAEEGNDAEALDAIQAEWQKRYGTEKPFGHAAPKLVSASPPPPAPTPSYSTQTGRGPSGKLRNFKAMSDSKFDGVYAQVTSENNDPEAIAAVKSEFATRWPAPAKSTAAGLGVAPGRFTPDVGPVSASSAASVGSVAGKRVVVTGVLSTGTRKAIHGKIAMSGGKPQPALTKSTDLLVVGDNAGSKLAKAHEMGIPVITEHELLKLLESLSPRRAALAERVGELLEAGWA